MASPRCDLVVVCFLPLLPHEILDIGFDCCLFDSLTADCEPDSVRGGFPTRGSSIQLCRKAQCNCVDHKCDWYSDVQGPGEARFAIVVLVLL